MKRLGIILLGILITIGLAFVAYIDRGYFAVGGEWLLVPVCWLVYKNIQEVVGNEYKGRM